MGSPAVFNTIPASASPNPFVNPDGEAAAATAVVEEERGFRLPSVQQTQRVLHAAARKAVVSRALKTQKMYGNIQNPSDGKGYVGEFYMWCVAGPNTYVKNYKTSADKKPFDCLASSILCHSFLTEHFLCRPLSDAKGNFTKEEAMSKSNLDNCVKALSRHFMIIRPMPIPVVWLPSRWQLVHVQTVTTN